MRESLTHVTLQVAMRSEAQEMLQSSVAQCEKAMQPGKRKDLPKILQTKLNEQKREKEKIALEKACSPPKTAELVTTPTTTSANASATTTTLAKARVHVGKGKESALKETKKGENQEKPREE